VTAFDAHAHVIVPELARSEAHPDPWRPLIEHRGASQTIELDGRQIRSAVEEFSDLDLILSTLQQRGVGRVLLCPWVALLFGELDAVQALDRCRLQNHGLADLHRRSPDRVVVLGSVPLQDPESAAAELERIMGTPGFAGVEIAASVAGDPLGHPRFSPFWEAAEACDALVFIHPTTRAFSEPVFGDHYLWNLVGNPFETTLAAAHLVLSGTMARHPRLRVLLAHAGGAILALRGRLRHAQSVIAAAGPPDAPAADTLILERFLFDTVTHDPRLLGDLVATVGAARVLLGSDYPFDMADPDPVRTVMDAGLSAGEQQALLEGNAVRELRTAGGRGGHGG
jgi:aminocarboxymuconate-semialdehyde decarboxylase